jgi:hypothetical protein
MTLSLFREDQEKQSSGAPIYINDMTFIGRRWGTEASQKAIARISKQLFGIAHKSTATDQIELYANWLIEYALVGWENVISTDGQVLEFTKRNASMVFLNEEYWGHGGLIEQIVSGLMSYENYLHDEANEDIDTIKKP